MKTMISFPKPLVAAVNGSAVGLGTTILPLCDIVYASDKATFSCPYSRLGHTPEGCGSYTLPQVLGMAMVSDWLDLVSYENGCHCYRLKPQRYFHPVSDCLVPEYNFHWFPFD